MKLFSRLFRIFEWKPKYISDQPDYRHLSDRERYQALYNEVGLVKANKIVQWRPEWMLHFKPKPNSRILELGAHNGPNLIHYGREGHWVDGVEISETLISTFEKFKKNEQEEVRKRIRMIKEWIEDFKPSFEYDYVLCTEILEHVADPIIVLKKARDCVKSDGEIYISSPETHWGNNTHVRSVGPEDLKSWLKAAGLEAGSLFVENGRTFCIAHRK